MIDSIKITIPLCLFSLLWLTSCQQKERDAKGNGNLSTELPDDTEQEFQFLTKKNSFDTGISFKNEIDETPHRNILLYQQYYMGGGVALGDVNNDGKTDVFFTANLKSNKLYLNKGEFKFEDITQKAGLSKSKGPSWTTGTTMVDINNDGYLDIYVCRSGNLRPENRRNLLYVNNQDGTFTEDAASYGLDDSGYSVQAVFFDYDKDGDLDMFLVNHGLEYYGRPPNQGSSARDPYVGDKLYQNQGDKFLEVGEEAGIIGTKEGFGLGVAVGDLNNNGWDDIYVTNDFFEHDYLYLNQGDGTYKESIKSATRQISFFSMGVDLADFNNDGWQDVVTLDMAIEDHARQKANLGGINRFQFWDFVDKGYHYQYMYNSLHLNNGNDPSGNLDFSNIARQAGISQTDWSWAALFADLDNDGWKDLLVTNGLRKDVMNNDFIDGLNKELGNRNISFTDLSPAEAKEILDEMPSEKVRNYLFHNQGGLDFENKAEVWGLGDLTFSNGAAYADLDNDGDLDLVINNLDDYAGIYENKADERTNGFLRINLKGNAKNPFGFGARVTVYKDNDLQFQQLYPTRGFQSSVEPIIHFGMGDWKTLDSVKVEWYDNKTLVLENVSVNQQIELDYAQAVNPVAAGEKDKTKLFREQKGKLNIDFRHEEIPFDDFSQQDLLPRRFSTEGPCLEVADVNGDGLVDVFLGGAKGQAAELYIQTKQGKFVKAKEQPWMQDAGSEDVAALFFDVDQDGSLDLYVVSGSTEFGAKSGFLQDRLYFNDGKGNFVKSKEALPSLPTNTTSVVDGDFDGDGDQDLFIGGGVETQRYPYASPSYLLENRDGKFVDVTPEKAPEIRMPGIVKDAIWTDFDKDGQLDLIVVGEWMPLKFYKNNDGELRLETDFLQFYDSNGKKISQELTSGWWNRIVPFDIDQDGNMDYLLGNMGLNYRFRPNAKEPLEIFAGDFSQSGNHNFIIGYHQEGSLYPIHGREDLSKPLPSIKRWYNNYSSYSQATIEDIISHFSSSPELHLKTHMMENVLLKNERNGKFVFQKLPQEAQISSVQDFLVKDFDGDGYEDVLLVGNFHGIETKTPRDDAGIGLYLKGGQGEVLKPVVMRNSGFYAPHDARNLEYIETAEGSFVIVANNDEEIQVFKVKNN